MNPVLYRADERSFRTFGLGEISDAYKVTVTRERNGNYDLYIKYPVNGHFASVFKEEMKIKSDAGKRTKWQTFEINRIVKNSSEHIEIYARHISMRTSDLALKPIVKTSKVNAETALKLWKENLVGDDVFDVSSDIQTLGDISWEVDKIGSARKALGGASGSILDVFGGEYEFDNNLIILHKQMGRKAPTVLEYGRNLLSVEEERLLDGNYTSIYPFARYTPNGEESHEILVTLPEHILDGPYLRLYAQRRISLVDFSGKFDDKHPPTAEKLRSLGQSYINSNNIGAPKISTEVSYVDLSQTLDYQDFGVMEEVELCDIIPLYYPQFDITTTTEKVVKVVYDVYTDSNEEITLGTIGQSLSSSMTAGIADRLSVVEERQASIESTLPQYLISGTGNKIWHETPAKNIEHKIGDTWFEKNGQYQRMYIWNGMMWEKRIDTEDIDKVKKEVNRRFEEVKTTTDRAISEVNKLSAEASKKAGTSEDLAKEAKRISIDSVAKLEEFKRQATSAQTALSGDLDVFKRTVTNEVNQASEHRRTTTEALSRMTGQMNGFATKSEVKQDIDGLTQTFAKMKVGGTNLLKGSKGPFMPDIKPANFDNNILYAENTSIYMERGQEYIVSAKTDGNFTDHHDWSKESDNVVLWIMGKKLRPYQIVSDLNTGTTGTKIIWNKPTGIYHLRVNTYHKEASKSVWDVKIEKGNIATDWSPAIEDVESQITEARTEFKQTADGLSTKMATVESYIGQDGQRQESLQRYAREESAKQATAVRELVSRDFVGKATYQEDVKGLERRFSAISTQTNNDIATKIAQYKQTVDGQFASITSQIAGKVNNVDFQRVRETAKLHERILGTSETGAPDKLSRLVMSSEIFQTEVGKYVTDDNNLIVNSETMDKHVLVNPRQGNNIFVNGGVFTIKAQGLTSHNWSGFTLPIYVRKIYKGETYSLGFKYRIRGALDFGFNVTVKNHSQNRSIFTGIVGRSNSPVSDEWKDFQGTFYMPSDFEFGNDKIFPFYCYVSRNGWVEIKEIMLVRGSNTGPYKPSQFDDAYKQTKEAKDLAENAQAKAIEVAEKARQAQQTAEATRTQVTQLAGSYAIKNLNSAGDLISGINLGANGHNRFDGKLTHITGETLIDNAVIKDGMIANLNANKITGGTIDASKINVINVNASNILAGTLTGMKIRGGQIDSVNGNMHINLQTNQFIFNGRAGIEFKSPGNSIEFNSGGRKAFLAPTVSHGTNYAAFAFGVNDRGDHEPNRDFVGLKIFNEPDSRQVVIVGDLILTSYADQSIKTTPLKKLFELINDNFKRLREFRVENGEGSPGFWDVSI